ncbi:MAG: thiamine-phosphate kinase [Alphaproteobacteria bacterium]|nr:thiamine-phosphate kinase [Alphaproteobacteria bacterium]
MAENDGSDEFGLIARYFAPLAAEYWGAFNLLDDAAVLSADADEEVVITTDVLVEGVHFRREDKAGGVARKALRVNLSDLAAMAAQPVAYTLGLALPHSISEDWIAEFAAGLAVDQEMFELSLIGGDTVATPGPLTISITAFGTCQRGLAVKRNGARTDDRIYVSGTIGDAALGLRALRAGMAADNPDVAPLIDRYLLPRPRVALGLHLAGMVHAMIDVSDGLVADLRHVASASGVGAEIWLDRVPVSAAAKRQIAADDGLTRLAITGGDDYELLFAAPESETSGILGIAEKLGTAITEIGCFLAEPEVKVRGHDGRMIEIDGGGYRHF